MKTNVLNELHWEYSHRFKVEFHQLLEQQTFAAAIFRNSELLFKREDTSFSHTLGHCFGCSFEGMALGLSRLWDERRDDEHLISIPNLVILFESYQFLGCHGLGQGREDRKKFDSLYSNSLRTRLRVLRTEALAHSVVVGKSKDRSKSDIKDNRDFDIVNGDAVAYCRSTLDLLFSLNDQLTLSKWRGKKSMVDMVNEWDENHINFLRHFVSEVQ